MGPQEGYSFPDAVRGMGLQGDLGSGLYVGKNEYLGGACGIVGFREEPRGVVLVLGVVVGGGELGIYRGSHD
jgi:hypothetical protein